jgi:hypothetical protein
LGWNVAKSRWERGGKQEGNRRETGGKQEGNRVIKPLNRLVSKKILDILVNDRGPKGAKLQKFGGD